MHEGTFLSLTSGVKSANNNFRVSKYSSNPLADDNLDYDFKEDTEQSKNISDDKSVKEAINVAKKDESKKNESSYEYYSEKETKFSPKDILNVYEITKDDLKYATGEQLAGLYLEADYSDDSSFLEHNSMLITLLSGASSEQIEDFMSTLKDVTQSDDFWENNYNFSYDNLGKQLLYASKAQKLTGENEYNEFMETVSKNPDLFPSYNEYVGIAFGNQL